MTGRRTARRRYRAGARASTSRDGALVRRVAIGVQQADGNGLHAGIRNLGRDALDRIDVERQRQPRPRRRAARRPRGRDDAGRATAASRRTRRRRSRAPAARSRARRESRGWSRRQPAARRRWSTALVATVVPCTRYETARGSTAFPLAVAAASTMPTTARPGIVGRGQDLGGQEAAIRLVPEDAVGEGAAGVDADAPRAGLHHLMGPGVSSRRSAARSPARSPVRSRSTASVRGLDHDPIVARRPRDRDLALSRHRAPTEAGSREYGSPYPPPPQVS